MSQLAPGTMIDKYRVVEQIGAGGMGTVHDVIDVSVDKPYVIKILHPKYAGRPEVAQRMVQEARVVAKFDHPHIVQVITAGVTPDGRPYFVMAKLTGYTLGAVLNDKGKLDLVPAIGIVNNLLDALEYAHDRGVVHRDVKPENIFLHRDQNGLPVVKLLDFGVMEVLEQESSDNHGRLIGTLKYMAPEQISGERVTPKTDSYAAGLVLFECIAGHHPFEDFKGEDAIKKAHTKIPPPPLSRYASVPVTLDEILLSALAKSPKDRPDALSFRERLRGVLKQLAREAEQNANPSRQSTLEGPMTGVGAPAAETAPTQSANGPTARAPAFASTLPAEAPGKGQTLKMNIAPLMALSGQSVVHLPPQHATAPQAHTASTVPERRSPVSTPPIAPPAPQAMDAALGNSTPSGTSSADARPNGPTAFDAANSSVPSRATSRRWLLPLAAASVLVVGVSAVAVGITRSRSAEPPVAAQPGPTSPYDETSPTDTPPVAETRPNEGTVAAPATSEPVAVPTQAPAASASTPSAEPATSVAAVTAPASPGASTGARKDVARSVGVAQRPAPTPKTVDALDGLLERPTAPAKHSKAGGSP